MNTTDHRAAIIAGLRDLAVFLEANPAVPVPVFPKLLYFAAGTDPDMCAEIDAIAEVLGTGIDPGDIDYGHYRTVRAFGPVQYSAVGVLALAKARHDANSSYMGCVTPDPVPSSRTA
ncbi:hypothetical protein ACLQ2R_05310 [Streptosporangium sp. DT93]|uniref:hypothetical protein n=1 Tax=Streptosporangium sp. DT93 TaxID=3393428 RepID=UPI003CF2DA81